MKGTPNTVQKKLSVKSSLLNVCHTGRMINERDVNVKTGFVNC